jgi:hypothetical protein
MTKERIVVLCVCAILMGTIYAQWIAWACHLVMPSMLNAPARLVPFGPAAPSESVMEFVSAGWPPLGFVYAEARRLNGKPGGMNACRGSVTNAFPRLAGQPIQPPIK